MVSFYTGTLGFEVLRKFDIATDDFRTGVGIPKATARIAHLRFPYSTLELELLHFTHATPPIASDPRTDSPGLRHIAFVVRDLDRAVDLLTAQGISLLSDPITVHAPESVAGIRFVYFQDPEGNIVELNQLPGESAAA